MQHFFRPVGKHCVVFGIFALVQGISFDDGGAAGWEINQVTRVTGRTILNDVVLDDIDACAAFDLVADSGALGCAISQGKFSDCTYVYVVRSSVALSVVIEFAAFYCYFALWVGARKYAVFVFSKQAVTHGQIGAFLADAGAVSVRHFCIGEFDVFHGGIAPLDDPDALASHGDALTQKPGPAVYAAQGEVVGSPDGRISGVYPCFDFDDIAGLDQCCGLAGEFDGVFRAHPDRCGLRGGDGAQTTKAEGDDVEADSRFLGAGPWGLMGVAGLGMVVRRNFAGVGFRCVVTPGAALFEHLGESLGRGIGWHVWTGHECCRALSWACGAGSRGLMASGGGRGVWGEDPSLRSG